MDCYAGEMLKRKGVQSRLLSSGVNPSGSNRREDISGGKFKGLGTCLLGFLLTGLLMAGSFPGWGWSWLAHIALVPGTIAAMRAKRLGIMLLASYLAGVLWWAWGLGWLMALAGGGYFSLCLIFGFYWVMSFWGIRLIGQRHKIPMVLTLPMVWVAVEFIRGQCLAGGLEWFSLGYSQANIQAGQPAGNLVQLASLLSVYGVSFAVCVSNGLCVDLLTKKLFVNRGHGKKTFSKTFLFSTIVWLIVVGGGTIWGMMIRRGSDSFCQPNEGIQVTAIQTDVMSLEGFSGTDEANQLVDLLGKIKSADLIVLPESTCPLPLNEQALKYFDQWLGKQSGGHQWEKLFSNIAIAHKSYVLLGGGAQLRWDDKAFPLERYNSVYFFDPAGIKSASRYDKIHLVPFGEYIPWLASWDWAMEKLEQIAPFKAYRLDPGKAEVVFTLGYRESRGAVAPAGGAKNTREAKQIRIVTPICFEDVVGRRTREMVYAADGRKRADLLVNVTNDGWFSGHRQHLEHFQIAVLRSIENRIPTVRSVNTGVSGIIDPWGRVVARAQPRQAVLVQGRVRGWPQASLFGRIGYWPIMAMSLVAGLLWVTALFKSAD